MNSTSATSPLVIHENKVQVVSNLVSKDNRRPAALQAAKLGVVALLKATGNAGMLSLVGGAAIIAAYATFQIASIVIGILVLPTAIIPPLYGAIVFLGSLVPAALVGHLIVKKYGNGFFEQMKMHFNQSLDLFRAAKDIYLIKT